MMNNEEEDINISPSEYIKIYDKYIDSCTDTGKILNPVTCRLIRLRGKSAKYLYEKYKREKDEDPILNFRQEDALSNLKYNYKSSEVIFVEEFEKFKDGGEDKKIRNPKSGKMIKAKGALAKKIYREFKLSM